MGFIKKVQYLKSKYDGNKVTMTIFFLFFFFLHFQRLYTKNKSKKWLTESVEREVWSLLFSNHLCAHDGVPARWSVTVENSCSQLAHNTMLQTASQRNALQWTARIQKHIPVTDANQTDSSYCAPTQLRCCTLHQRRNRSYKWTQHCHW